MPVHLRRGYDVSSAARLPAWGVTWKVPHFFHDRIRRTSVPSPHLPPCWHARNLRRARTFPCPFTHLHRGPDLINPFHTIQEMYLPEDIIYHILTCMDDVRTLARATQVCKEWHAICQDVRIWSNKGLESVAIQRWTSLLHWAVAHNCSDLALRLMNMGMKVDLDDCPPDHNGFLHDAARYGHVEMAKVLLDCGCPINSRGRNMFTPLHHACQSGNRSMVTMLLKRGAEVDMRTTNLETPLHLAASRQQHSTLVTTMLDWGANIAVRDKSDWTPLHMAARNGCVENVRILLQRGAEIDAVNKSHTTPLHCAAQYGHLDVVSVLLQGGASVNMIDADRRWTPLQCACTHGYKDIAVMLLEHGACWTTGAGYPVLYEKYRQIKELMEAQGPSVVCV